MEKYEYFIFKTVDYIRDIYNNSHKPHPYPSKLKEYANENTDNSSKMKPSYYLIC